MADQTTLQTLIDRGDEMRQESFDSPIVDMWQNDVKAVVAEFGEETMKILKRAMFFQQMIMSELHGQQMHHEMISKIQALLQELKKRNPVNTKMQSQLISQKKEEAKASLGAKLGNTTFNNSTVTFGDNSPANNVQVGELMLAIINQAEEVLPEGSDKSSILDSLRSATANPTFAAIAGASLPEIVKQLFG